MAFARTVFGAGHRYGTGAIGTEATLKAFSVSDLKTFHASLYQPTNATLIVVGAVKADAVIPVIEKQLGAWRATAKTERAAVAQAPQLTARQIRIVDMPGAEQSQIRIGWVGVPRATGDYFTLQVLNTILGGSFTSRLNQNLREKNQFSYGASSRFDMRLSAGPFFAGAGVQTDKTADAVREFFNELGAIAKITPDELTKAKNYLALGFPSEFETIGDLAAHVEEMIVYRLPDNYFERYVANVQAVTLEGVQKAAATYIQPGRFAVVIAGDRKTIEAGIRGLKLGDVSALTVEQALGS
jgi:zinc protease